MKPNEKLCQWIVYRVFRAKPNEVLPKWLLMVVLVLMPERGLRALVTPHLYDPLSDCLIVNGVKVSLVFMRHLTSGPFPTPWVRAVRRDGNMVTVEKLVEK